MKRFDSEQDLMNDLFGLHRTPAPVIVEDDDEWQRFEHLARRVVAVPKAAIDAKRQKKQTAPKKKPVMPKAKAIEPELITYDLDAKAEEIAQLFEDPARTPNCILFRQPDDPYPKEEWRRAAKRAGELLHRRITVHTTGLGRTSAILEQNDEEQEAERQRLGDVMNSVLTQSPKPPPLPRNFRAR